MSDSPAKYNMWDRTTLKTDKPVLYLDMDGVICDYDKRVAELKEFGLSEHEARNAEGLFIELEPLIGAIESIHKLSEFFDIYILSTAPWSNVASWTEKRIWIGEYFPELLEKKLILSSNKGLLKGEYLIDDRYANGVGDFEGEHILFDSPEFPNWEVITKYLLDKRAY